MPDTRTMTGVVTLVQERRFQLADTAGRRHLFVLAESAAPDEAQLRAHADARTRVRVAYRAAPGLIAHLALGMEDANPETVDETHTQ